jgi:plastocyanin
MNSILSTLLLFVSLANAITHIINVNGTDSHLTFSPDNLIAAIGDTVEFTFDGEVTFKLRRILILGPRDH